MAYSLENRKDCKHFDVPGTSKPCLACAANEVSSNSSSYHLTEHRVNYQCGVCECLMLRVEGKKVAYCLTCFNQGL